MSQLKPVLSGKPTVYFMQLVPYAPKEVIDASIVQVITVTGSTGAIEPFRSAVEAHKSSAGCTGAASGSAMSDVDGKGKPFVGIVGWESLDASKAGGNSTSMGVDGEVEIHHVNFRYPIKGFGGL
jgi:hypothetical protein